MDPLALPQSILTCVELRVQTGNSKSISIDSALRNSLAKSIKTENSVIKQELFEKVYFEDPLRVKEEYLLPYEEFDQIQNIRVKEKPCVRYEELKKLVNVGLSVPYEEFENFVTNTVVEELTETFEEIKEVEYNVVFNPESDKHALPLSRKLRNNRKVVSLPVSSPRISVTYYNKADTKVTKRRKKPKKLCSADKQLLNCDMCDYKTIHVQVLTRHKKIHTGENPFTCTMCDFRCSEKKDYIAHKSVHTGSKPYTCNLCDYRATTKASVRHHRYYHYPEQLHFTCDVCEYKTPFKDRIRKHILSHSTRKPFVCHVCGFKSVHEDIFKKHHNIYSSKKPSTCNLCDCTTSHYNSLAKHTDTHFAVKPFICHIQLNQGHE